jgi:hypothetical protein
MASPALLRIRTKQQVSILPKDIHPAFYCIKPCLVQVTGLTSRENMFCAPSALSPGRPVAVAQGFTRCNPVPDKLFELLGFGKTARFLAGVNQLRV